MALSRNEYGEIEIEVTITREKLLARLRKNRDKHITEFSAALELWRKDVKQAFTTIDVSTLDVWPSELDELEADRPESHAYDYERAIDMFEMCVNDEIKLDSSSFNKFCRDEWDWKSDTSSNPYIRRVS